MLEQKGSCTKEGKCWNLSPFFLSLQEIYLILATVTKIAEKSSWGLREKPNFGKSILLSGKPTEGVADRAADTSTF